MVALLAWQNEWDTCSLSGGTGFAGTLLPENTQVNPVALAARVSSDTMVMGADRGSSVTWRAFAFVGTNATSFATIRVKLSDTAIGSAEVYDSGVINGGATANYQQIYHVANSNQSARYMEFTLVDSSQSNIDVGRVFGGPIWQPSIGADFGQSIQWQDSSNIQRSLGGQLIYRTNARFRTAQFTLRYETVAAMLNNPFELDRAKGIHSDVLVMLDKDNYPRELSVWGPVVQATPLTFWDMTHIAKRFVIEERL